MYDKNFYQINISNFKCENFFHLCNRLRQTYLLTYMVHPVLTKTWEERDIFYTNPVKFSYTQIL